MAQENLISDERLKKIELVLEKQEKILEKMESRAQLQSIFFWVKVASLAAVGIVSVMGVLWYAKIINDVSSQVEMIGR